MTSIVLDTPEQVVQQYSQMIHRQVHRCLAKLPRHTTLQPEDLYQEGVARVLHAFWVYQRTNAVVTTSARPAAPEAQGPVAATGKRQAGFTTYAQAAIMNGYGKLVKKEWRHWGHLIDPYMEVVDTPEMDWHKRRGDQVCPVSTEVDYAVAAMESECLAGV
jgi:hypothetical protein